MNKQYDTDLYLLIHFTVPNTSHGESITHIFVKTY